MRRIDPAERRARLVRRTLTGGGSPARVSDRLVGFHATDPMTVFLAAAARTDTSIEAVEHAMYEERTLVRFLGMRGTLFTLPVGLVEVVHAACTSKMLPMIRKNLLKALGNSELTGDHGAWLREVEAKTLTAVREAGEALGSELTAAVPELQTEFDAAPGKPYNRKTRVGSRVLNLLAAQGKIVRGRPSGSVVSSQYRWAPMEHWLGDELTELDRVEAQAELVRRWLASYGPGTVEDVQWWTGLTKTAVKKALVGASEVELEEGVGYVLPEDVEAVEPVAAEAYLLPSLDPTAMGYKHRDFYNGAIDGHRYDRSGNICPTVWWDGRIVGGWIQSRDTGEIRLELEEVGAEARVAIEEAAHQTAAFLGEIVVKPRFPTPLDKGLA